MNLCPVDDMKMQLNGEDAEFINIDLGATSGWSLEKKYILDIVSEVFGINSRNLIGPSREVFYAWPRQAAYMLYSDYTKLSSPAIGRIFGDRDHTTILHGIKRARARILQETHFAELVHRCRLRIKCKTISCEKPTEAKPKKITKPAAVTHIRACMRCGEAFSSSGNGHRHCTPCRAHLSAAREFEGMMA